MFLQSYPTSPSSSSLNRDRKGGKSSRSPKYTFTVLLMQNFKLVSDRMTGSTHGQAAKKAVRALSIPLKQTRFVYVLRKEGKGEDFRVKIGCYKIWKTKTTKAVIGTGSNKVELKQKPHSESIFVPFYLPNIRRNSLIEDLKASSKTLRIHYNIAMWKRRSQH